MSRFVDYFIVESDSIVNLQAAVNQLATEGYRPQGGMTTWTYVVDHYSDRDGELDKSVHTVRFGQAMILMDAD